MSEQTLHTWNNERWIIEQLAQAIHRDDTEAMRRFGRRLLDGKADDGWSGSQLEAEGTFIPFGVLHPSNVQDVDIETLCEQGVISIERARLIEEGSPLAGNELQRWREIAVDRAFEPECETLWSLFTAKRHRGQLLSVVGVGRGIVERLPRHLEYAVAANTEVQAMHALKLLGFTGRKDFRARSAALFASWDGA